MCDTLIVGVLTDEATIERKPTPIMGFRERYRLVSALKVVDMAVIQHEYPPHKNAKQIKPDILFESTSHDSKLIAHSKSLIESLGGRLVVMPYYEEQSSTKIKEKIINGNKTEERE
jgi:bifunctional ADP-heptose synthase (sugar kinase/adenylyltransferase)